MTGAAIAEARLVRCPKCRKLLLEEPKIPVYQCGGCGVILQAKKRKNGRSISSGSLEKSAFPKKQYESDSEYVKSTSSGQMENRFDMKDCSSNLNAKEQVESADCSIEPSGGSRNFLNGVSLGESESSSDLNAKEQLENKLEYGSEDVKVSSGESECLSDLNAKEQLEHGSEELKSTSSVQIENYCDKKECSSDLSVEVQVESADDSIEPSGGSRNFLNGVSLGESEFSSNLSAKEQLENQLEHDSEDVNSTSSVQMENYCDKNECSSDLNAEVQVERAACSIKPPGGSRNFLNGVSSGESGFSSDLNVTERLENQLEHDLDNVKSTSSVQMENYCDKKECSSDLNAEVQVESADCSIKPPGGSRNFLNGVSLCEADCSSDLSEKERLENQLEHGSEDVKSTSSVQMENYSEKIECSSDLNVKDQVESADCSIEPSGSKNLLNGVSLGDPECSSDLNAEEQTDSTDCCIEPSESGNFLNGVSSGDSLDLDNGKEEQIESGDCTIKHSGSTSFLKGVSSGDFLCHEREEKSSESGKKAQTDENDESESPDSQVSSLGKSSSFTSQRHSDESNPMKMNFTSLNKQLWLSQETSHHMSDHTRSVETVGALGTTDNGNISEELSCAPGDISKSSTVRSSHAYDGSISSFDEWDNQVPEWPAHLPKRSWFRRQVVAESPSNKERTRRENWLMDKKIGDNAEVQDQARKLLFMSSDEKHGLKWQRSRIQAQGQEVSPDSDGLHPIKNWMMSEKDGYWSREFSQRGFPTVYENGNPSNCMHEEFPCSTSACSSSKVDYVEQMELLRKVDELRYQLSRSYNHRGMANGRLSARSTQQEKRQPLYYSHEQLDSKVPHCYDANYNRHPYAPYWPRKQGCQQCGFAQTGCQKCEFSQTIFSGQGTNCRNHVGYSCYHCCPESWHCMTQLPPPSTCCNNGPYRGHSANICYEPYGSSSSTQQKHINSYFSVQGCQIHSQDQVLMDRDVLKKYHQDKRQPIKRHCRPIAGGAPFITCYACCALLQLPEDFVLQKRIHQLQCSSCSRILKFSLQNRTHITPYNRNPVEPSPSEVDNGSDATTRSYLVSISHVNNDPQVEPVSYSEDCGPSMHKSCSTESDPFSILRGNADDKELPSGSNSEVKVEEKSKSAKKCKTSIEAFESTSASSNVVKAGSSSLDGEVATRSSPLHQLMGYSSPSKILDGS